MGVYVNPGNQAFAEIAGPQYVDKTGMISLVNDRINSPEKLICVSRPRRFGKSYAARMLAAYYDKSCDSHLLFDGRKISGTLNYEEYLNRYNVIYLEITSFLSQARQEGKPLKDIPGMIKKAIWKDLVENGFSPLEGDTLTDFLIRCSERPGGARFVFIIDEWDAVIREAKDDPLAQKVYLDLLREWFKNGTFTPKVVAAAYMTGILPIKKDGSQSAISDFDEYTMIRPGPFAEYVGFTEAEVESLCQKHGIDYPIMKQWYDGYSFRGAASIYNPNSVMKAIRNDDFDSYWTETSASEGLMDYITKDYDNLTRTIAELIGGIEIPLNPTGFANDLTTFKGKDDVLTLLVHLGYLAYLAQSGTVRIPNEEIRREFRRSIREVSHEATRKRVQESDQLFLDTIQGNEKAVAAQIEKIHQEETVPLHYNQEESLRMTAMPIM